MKFVFLWFDIAHGHSPSFNHGLASIAAVLKGKGHSVLCIQVKEADGHVAVRDALTKAPPDCIGFSFCSNQRKYIDAYARGIRQYFSGPLLAGGIHPTLDPLDTLRCEEIDGVCIGEGEIPLSMFAERYENNKPFHDVPSFFWRSNKEGDNSIIQNPVLQFETDLSMFPAPDYSIFDVEKVVSDYRGYFRIMISRGCPYLCTYCCNHAFRKVYPSGKGYFRILPVQRAVGIMERIKTQYPFIKGFVFDDDLLLFDKLWFEEFSLAYSVRVSLPYLCNCRFELVSEEIVDSLKASGCRLVMFGLESGDEELRKNLLKRHYSDQKVLEAAAILHSRKVPFITANIFGFPFETKDKMEKTVSLNKQIRPVSGVTFFFYPYPGTDLYRICKENNLLNEEDMASVSGYKEKPVIRLTNCSEADCIEQRQKLAVYFATRSFTTLLGIDNKKIDSLVERIFSISPSLITYLLEQENIIKKIFRRLQLLKWRKEKAGH